MAVEAQAAARAVRAWRDEHFAFLELLAAEANVQSCAHPEPMHKALGFAGLPVIQARSSTSKLVEHVMVPASPPPQRLDDDSVTTTLASPPPQRLDTCHSRSSCMRTLATKARAVKEISQFSWADGKKNVKVYLTVEGLDSLSKDAVALSWTETSCIVSVRGSDTDHVLKLERLFDRLRKATCKRKSEHRLVLVLWKAQVSEWPKLRRAG